MAGRQMFSMTRNLLFVALTLIPHILQSASAAIMYQPPAKNLTGTALNWCTDKREWYGSATGQDCQAAVQSLYDLEVKPRMNSPEADPMDDFEFHTPKVADSGLPPMLTPRRYTVGTCTIAVVMLSTIESNIGDRSLPGGVVKGPFASRDVTSYQELWEAAVQIESICLQGARRPGWAAEGGREAIGVFMWGTDSSVNQRIPPGPKVGFLKSFFSLYANSSIAGHPTATA